jgi:hypothetical protein
MTRTPATMFSSALLCCACASGQHEHGLYRVAPEEPKACAHSVRLLRAEQVPSTQHDELARLSATCPKVDPTRCERILLERGCELGADVVVLNGEGAVHHRAGGPVETMQSAVALRFASSGAP